MSTADLDTALLDLTDAQLNAALVRRAQAKADRMKRQSADRMAKLRERRLAAAQPVNSDAGVTQSVTQEKRNITSESYADSDAGVTQEQGTAPSPSPALSPVPPIPPTPTPNPLNPPEPPQAAGGEDEEVKAEKQRKAAEHRALSIRIGSIVRRKPSTDWLPKEKTALVKLYPLPEADIAVVERYYAAPMDAARDYRRRDLFTLLNNWPGEVDRANRHFGLNGHSLSAAKPLDEIVTEEIFRAFMTSDPDNGRFAPMLNELPLPISRLRTVRETFTAWKAKQP